MSLTNTIKVSCTLIGDPSFDLIAIGSPLFVILNAVLFPSNKLSNESNVSSIPTDQPVNLSVNCSCIVNSNSLYAEVVGIPSGPPIGTVSFSFTPYP